MKIKYLVIIFSALISINSFAKDSGFIAGFEDIPIATNMFQNQDNDISFNNEETGYIETSLIAKKKTSFDSFKRFYIETLPHLGWKLHLNSKNILIFYRENDILEFQKQSNTPLKVNITLKNRN
jgi:hypothetical protein